MMLSASRRAALSRPQGPRRAALSVRMAPVARASPKQDVERVQKVLEQTIKEAEEACAGEGGAASGECAAAFDAVEEVSAALAHKKTAAQSSDPLEEFCDDNPDADECRIYDD